MTAVAVVAGTVVAVVPGAETRSHKIGTKEETIVVTTLIAHRPISINSQQILTTASQKR